MSQVNVLFAVNDDTFQLLKDNFRRDENGDRVRTDLTDAQAKKLRASISGRWKTPTIAGTKYHIFSWYVPREFIGGRGATEQDGLKWVEFLLNKWPNKFQIIGAWNKDGSQFGTKIEQVENGTQLVPEMETIQEPYTVQVVDIEATVADGTQVIYKDETRYRSVQQPTGQQVEIPKYDEVVTGTPVYPIHPWVLANPDKVFADGATGPMEVNNVCGWKPRRWS